MSVKKFYLVYYSFGSEGRSDAELFEFIAEHYPAKRASENLIFVYTSDDVSTIKDNIRSYFQLSVDYYLIMHFDGFQALLSQEFWKWVTSKEPNYLDKPNPLKKKKMIK